LFYVIKLIYYQGEKEDAKERDGEEAGEERKQEKS